MTGRMCIFINFNGIETATGRLGLYFWDCVNIATEHIY